MKKEKMSYEEAMTRLEELVQMVESDKTGIDQLTDLLKEARELTAFCRKKLYSTDEEIRNILENDENK